MFEIYKAALENPTLNELNRHHTSSCIFCNNDDHNISNNNSRNNYMNRCIDNIIYNSRSNRVESVSGSGGGGGNYHENVNAFIYNNIQSNSVNNPHHTDDHSHNSESETETISVDNNSTEQVVYVDDSNNINNNINNLRENNQVRVDQRNYNINTVSAEKKENCNKDKLKHLIGLSSESPLSSTYTTSVSKVFVTCTSTECKHDTISESLHAVSHAVETFLSNHEEELISILATLLHRHFAHLLSMGEESKFNEIRQSIQRRAHTHDSEKKQQTSKIKVKELEQIITERNEKFNAAIANINTLLILIALLHSRESFIEQFQLLFASSIIDIKQAKILENVSVPLDNMTKILGLSTMSVCNALVRDMRHGLSEIKQLKEIATKNVIKVEPKNAVEVTSNNISTILTKCEKNAHKKIRKNNTKSKYRENHLQRSSHINKVEENLVDVANQLREKMKERRKHRHANNSNSNTAAANINNNDNNNLLPSEMNAINRNNNSNNNNNDDNQLVITENTNLSTEMSEPPPVLAFSGTNLLQRAAQLLTSPRITSSRALTQLSSILSSSHKPMQASRSAVHKHTLKSTHLLILCEA